MPRNYFSVSRTQLNFSWKWENLVWTQHCQFLWALCASCVDNKVLSFDDVFLMCVVLSRALMLLMTLWVAYLFQCCVNYLFNALVGVIRIVLYRIIFDNPRGYSLFPLVFLLLQLGWALISYWTSGSSSIQSIKNTGFLKC